MSSSADVQMQAHPRIATAAVYAGYWEALGSLRFGKARMYALACMRRSCTLLCPARLPQKGGTRAVCWVLGAVCWVRAVCWVL